MSRGSEEVTCGQYALQESSEAKSSHVELARAPSPLPLAEELSIPDGGYGWVNVFAVLLINGFTWGAVTVSQDILQCYQQQTNKSMYSRTVYIWAII